MRNLLNFIVKHQFFFIFLGLQVIAFTILFQNNYYHRSFFVNSANHLTGGLYSKYADVSDYFHLKDINQQLVEENKTLIQQTPYSYLKTDQQVFQHEDTIYKRQYEYVNARVINNSVNRRNNYITLDKGQTYGIEQDMGVITPKGVIGIVKDVSENFSSVLSLLHRDVRISAKIKKNEHIGTILWDMPDYRKVTMQDIPPHVEVLAGDTIITSGYSNIFPEGILIGTVEDYQVRSGESFLTLEVELFEDFNNLTHVYVVKNFYGKEQDLLEFHSRTEPVYW